MGWTSMESALYDSLGHIETRESLLPPPCLWAHPTPERRQWEASLGVERSENSTLSLSQCSYWLATSLTFLPDPRAE